MADQTGWEGAATDTDCRTAAVTFNVSLMRNRKTGRVLFVEAGKDFVETLLSFLLLPMGTIFHMLATGAGGRREKGLSGISNIFKSVEKIDSSFMHVDKKIFLQLGPEVAGTCGLIGLFQGLVLPKKQLRPPLKNLLKIPEYYFQCRTKTCTHHSVDTTGVTCYCRSANYSTSVNLPVGLSSLLQANIIRQLEDASVEEATCSAGQGFVSETMTYMVTDNLEITPSTTIRSVDVLNSFRVATLADLERNDIIVSITQILQLLQSALASNSCLNDVFGMK